MDRFTTLTIFAGIAFLVFGLAGGASALFIAKVSHRWMQFCNALAGGVMLGVALCHMLPDNVNNLSQWSSAIGSFFGGDEFPLAFFSVGMGFFVMVSLEYFLAPHDHSGPHADPQMTGIAGDRREVFEMASDSRSAVGETRSFATLQESHGAQVAGFAAFLGLGLHSVIEGIATGSLHDPDTFGILTIAVLMHKGFAAFAVGSSLLPVSKTNLVLWWIIVACWACTGPVGLIVGAILRESVENQGTALLQCIAAGTLLAVAITEMIAIGLEDRSVWKKRKIASVYLGYIAMAIIAIWA